MCTEGFNDVVPFHVPLGVCPSKILGPNLTVYSKDKSQFLVWIDVPSDLLQRIDTQVLLVVDVIKLSILDTLLYVFYLNVVILFILPYYIFSIF